MVEAQPTTINRPSRIVIAVAIQRIAKDGGAAPKGTSASGYMVSANKIDRMAANHEKGFCVKKTQRVERRESIFRVYGNMRSHPCLSLSAGTSRETIEEGNQTCSRESNNWTATRMMIEAVKMDIPGIPPVRGNNAMAEGIKRSGPNVLVPNVSNKCCTEIFSCSSESAMSRFRRSDMEWTFSCVSLDVVDSV